MTDIVDLKLQCQNRWISIFRTMGMTVRDDGRHSGCPVCGNGRNSHRFRIDKDGSGNWICTQCGAGDGIKLIQRFIGCNFKEALEKIQSVVGGCEVETKKEKPAYDVKKMLNNLWNKSTVLTGSDPVSKYLHARKLVLQPDNVRYCPELYHSSTKRHYAGMVARFVTKDNVPTCLHRTYLLDDQKADIESNKKMTPTTQPMAGGAIRLFSPDNDMFESDVLGIGEGIESCIAATQIFNIATWAALSTSLLESFDPPSGIRKIVIFSDNDSSFIGQKSSYVLANKLYKKDLIVSVEVPEVGGFDFNDILVQMSK